MAVEVAGTGYHRIEVVAVGESATEAGVEADVHKPRSRTRLAWTPVPHSISR